MTINYKKADNVREGTQCTGRDKMKLCWFVDCDALGKGLAVWVVGLKFGITGIYNRLYGTNDNY